MKQTIALLLLLTIVPCLARAQKKELSQARTYLKSRNKNYDQAEKLMTALLRDTAHRTNKAVYQVWLEAVKGQYDQANERLYLKQKQDTTAFFTLVRRMYTVAFTLDSLDMRPDKRGRVHPEYRQRNAAMLNTYRPNLFSGGTYFIRKGQWQEAYTYMDTYLDCARQPLFTGYSYATADSRMPEAAYWATYCGYKAKNADLTLRHHRLALQDTAHTAYALQFAAEAYRWQGDSLDYVATLEQGFSRYPLFPYFFPRLMDARLGSRQTGQALALADSALQACDTCTLFLFAKSSVLLRMQRWEESVRYSRLTMVQNDSLPEPYFNAGLAYVNMADQLDPVADKERRKDHYQRARTYMEYYRLLMPAEQEKWAPILYRIYLNLNLGRQFDEMDRLLRQMNNGQ